MDVPKGRVVILDVGISVSKCSPDDVCVGESGSFSIRSVEHVWLLGCCCVLVVVTSEGVERP